MFDVLTYQKGSSVLRMLEQYLGEEAFRAGVTRYLKTHAYSNTDTPDLWAALEAESGEPVAEIMDTWIYQGGYPRVTVSASDRGYEISQERFQYLGESDQTWKIPVLYRSSDGKAKIVVGDVPFFIDAGQDLVLNSGGEGFYRVDYAGNLGPELIDRFNGLAPMERYAVVSDLFANVLAGDALAADFVSLTSMLANEDELDVWNVALAGLGELDRVVASGDRGAMRGFISDLISAKSEELGWEPVEGESDRTRALRGLLLQTMGAIVKDGSTIAKARAVYDGSGEVDAEVAEAALVITASNGDIEDFDVLMEKFRTSKDPQARIRYLRTATAIPDTLAAEKMIRMVLDGDIRSQDANWVLARLIGNRDTGTRSWEMITENWNGVIASMPVLNSRRLLDLIQYRSEPDVAASIMQWLETHPIPSGGKHVAQKMEQLQVRVALREREAYRLGEVLGS
jgi:puromycin-sensitive aminopeptidase